VGKGFQYGAQIGLKFVLLIILFTQAANYNLRTELWPSIKFHTN